VSGAEIRYRTAGYYVFSPASDPILSDGRFTRGSVSRSSSSPLVAPPQSPRTPRRRTHPTRAQRDKGHGGIETLAGGATPRPASTRPAVGLAPATGHHTTHATQSTVRHAREGGTRHWRVFLVHSSPMCPPAAPAALARNMMRTQVHACHTAARDHARHQRHPFVWKMINSHWRRCARARVPRLRRGPRKEHVRAVPSVAPYEEVLLMHTASPPRRRLRQSIV